VSTATEILSETELQDILAKSRSNNEKKNITGLLVYSSGNILQVLEGSRQSLQDLYSIIIKDHRHFGFIKLQELPINERIFSEWSMGFKTVSPEEFKKVEGYLDIKNGDLLPLKDKEGTVKEILEMFIENNK